jgi:Outer membrane protein beta-barrel domain
MKRLVFVLTTFLIITSGYAQVDEKSERKFYKQSDWEFGFSSNIGSSTVKTVQPEGWNNGLPYGSYEYTENWLYLNLGVSTGFYLFNGLSIEPELDINSYAETISVSILGNLCYTFYLPQKKIFPYVKLGYGLSNYPENSVDIFNNIDFKTINVGAGVKLMYYSGMTFRVELNYRNLNGSNTFYPDQPDSYTIETTTSVISISLGVSILL